MSSHPEKQPEAPPDSKKSTHDLLESLKSISLKHIFKTAENRDTNGFTELRVVLAGQERREETPSKKTGQARQSGRVTTWGEVSDIRGLDALDATLRLRKTVT
ncbi:hypothetical protein N7520_003866 [Penicillium odoratum]|uniref:uncharacterized protein n=1 Tax=Penicillium odoratum TaxID=1167516 RepID=UPI0025465FB3|nr:uncharacterized protein N7520_003866 [Penicillium odoratum]KAJ5769307.1 hypothetical protein N7520_003866 [Penicillium odoratum]